MLQISPILRVPACRVLNFSKHALNLNCREEQVRAFPLFPHQP